MKGCRPLQPQEIKQLLDKLNPRDKLLCLSGLYFGTRISETLQLKFSDVSGDYINIKSQKNSENVTFTIGPEYKKAVRVLQKHYERSGIDVTPDTYLFLSREGTNQPLSRYQASRIIKKTCKTLGLEGKINSHSLRKTFVTAIYEKSGFNIAETKKYSRHKSLSNLDYYIGTCEELDLIKKLKW